MRKSWVIHIIITCLEPVKSLGHKISKWTEIQGRSCLSEGRQVTNPLTFGRAYEEEIISIKMIKKTMLIHSNIIQNSQGVAATQASIDS